GWKLAPFLLAPLAAIIGAILIARLTRMISGSWWIGVAAAAALATNASVVFDAVQPLSDVVAMTWSIAAIYFAMKSTNRSAMLAGFSFAVSAWVRPTNALLGAIYSLIRARRDRVHLMLALWWWPFFLFYSFYGPYETWWYTRFLLPAYPALIISALLAARDIAPRVGPAIVAATMIACGIF